MYSTLEVYLNNTQNPKKETMIGYTIKNNHLGQAWASALHRDYLDNPNIRMEKSFCLHGWSETNTKDKTWLCNELNWHIDRVEEYFEANNIDYAVDMLFDPDTVNQDQLNDIHRHFEVIQGHYHEPSDIWKTSTEAFRFSVNQFNHFCHELEGCLYREKSSNRTGSMIVCLYPNVKHDITLEQLESFELKDYRIGDVRLHYPQTGKQFIEAYLSGDTNVPADEIQPIRYVSGEFDLVFHDSVVDWNGFETWLEERGVDRNDPTNALGYAIVATGTIPDNILDYNNITEIKLYHILNDEPEVQLAGKQFNETWEDQYYGDRRRLYPDVE